LFLGGGPGFPAVGFVEDVGVFFAVEGGFVGFVLFEAVEIFEEEEPGGLLGVVELGGAAGFFAEGVVDVAEGLFEHFRMERRWRPFMGIENTGEGWGWPDGVGGIGSGETGRGSKWLTGAKRPG
jgi:hypothetical protein